MRRGARRGRRRQSAGRILGSDDCRWRRDQRERQALPRGRRGRFLGAALLAIFAALPLAAYLRALSSADLPAAPGEDVVALPAVSAAAPSPNPPRAPQSLFERLPTGRETLELRVAGPDGEESALAGERGVAGRLFELLPAPPGASPLIQGPLRVEYTFEAELTREVFRLLKRGRVRLGHVILLDPATGRVLAYASTDIEQFPPTRVYPAASLVKVITAAAALDRAPETANLPCRYTGSPYRLTPSRIDPPKRGNVVTLRKALATSNNQCFAQLAVHAVGAGPLLDAIARFGWLSEPAPAHPAGTADAGEDRFAVGKLGCGLAGCHITPLHAAQLAGILARGERVTPRWIDRVIDVHGDELPLPAIPGPRRVISPELTRELRAMLVDTTVRGTARSAFRNRRGQPLLGPVKVAGKTGSLSGRDPEGRYEWFIGAAPAEAPRIAIAVVLVQDDLWWRNASQLAADVLHHVFCSEGGCRPDAPERWTRHPAEPRSAAAAIRPSSP